MNRILREPLLHFLILGAALFALYGWLNRAGFHAPDQIVVSSGQIRSLGAQFRSVWQREPTPQELQGLIDSWVREEIFYREALAMGLDRDDPVVRRRLTQKVQFIVDGATPVAPTAEELQGWLDEHPGDYRVEPTYSLQQVFFDPQRHHDRLDSAIAAARRALDGGRPMVGDPTMLPPTLTASASGVARVFGSDFEGALGALAVGVWQGPVRSGFGLHLVLLSAREEGRKAGLDEVRAAVERDLLHAKTQEATDAVYSRLRSNYSVRIDAGNDAGDTAQDPAG